MKRYLLLLLVGAFSLSACSEQSATVIAPQLSSREEIDACPQVAVPTMTIYNGEKFINEAPAAPKGFKPLFIAGYLRHGSRMESEESYAVSVHDYFKRADEAGLLTPLGKKVYDYSKWFLNEHKDCVGDLTNVGYEQHKQLAKRYYEEFPMLFKGESKAILRGSVSLRATLSMAAFNEGLKECNTHIRTNLMSSDATTTYIRPQKSDYNKLYSPEEEKEYKAFLKKEVYSKLLAWGERQDMDHCKRALFTDPDRFFAMFDDTPFYIVANIYKRMAFAQNLGVYDRTLIDEVFSAEERYTIYKHENARWYFRTATAAHPICANYLAQSRYTVERLFDEIDAKINGENSANSFLCFGHDLNILPLITVLGLDKLPLSFGNGVESVDFIAEHWRSYKYAPKAANMMLVVYRNKEGKVLVRPQINERDVEVDIASATPYYYDWEEFKRFVYVRLDTVDQLKKR